LWNAVFASPKHGKYLCLCRRKSILGFRTPYLEVDFPLHNSRRNNDHSRSCTIQFLHLPRTPSTSVDAGEKAYSVSALCKARWVLTLTKPSSDSALPTPQILSDIADAQVLIPHAWTHPPAIAGLLWLTASSCTHESRRCILHAVPGPAAVPGLKFTHTRVHAQKKRIMTDRGVQKKVMNAAKWHVRE